MLDFCKAGNKEHEHVLYFLMCVCFFGDRSVKLSGGCEALRWALDLIPAVCMHLLQFCGWLFEAWLIQIFINAEQ